MESPSEHYRQLASKAREQAAASSLPQVKLQYLRSAQHFDEIVDKLESVARAKARNEAAREEAISSDLCQS
jgi:hypothetical protein